MKKLNYFIGRLANHLGYTIKPTYKVPRSTLNILKIGVSHLKREKRDLTMVQIGAFDGEFIDPLKDSIDTTTNRILLVEPQPKAYERLLRKYGDYANVKIENSAVSEEDGEVKMFLPKNEDVSPRATLNADQLKNFAMENSLIREISVQSISIPTLMKKYSLDEIDVLQIDTEGMDFKILNLFLERGLEPVIINLEIVHLAREELESLREILSKRGYEYVEYGIDIFALKSSHVMEWEKEE